MSLLETQQELVEEFAMFDDWQDRYAHIIDLGRDLAPIDDAWKIEANRVKGCQSSVWLHSEFRDGKIVFFAESDALIVQGLIAVLMRAYSERTPEEILSSSDAFLAEIGLDKHLTQSRTNGLASMMDTIRRRAVEWQVNPS